MPMEFFSVGKKIKNIYINKCKPICDKYDVNQTCIDVLMFLNNHPKNNTARDLCTIRGIKTGIVSVAIEMLMEKGLITTIEDKDDRRVKRLIVTQKARPLINDGKKVQDEFKEKITKGVTKEELAEVKKIFSKLVNNIKQLDKGDNWNA